VKSLPTWIKAQLADSSAHPRRTPSC